MALSVNVTVNMPMEMVDDVTVQAEEHGMSRAEYIRFLIRQADDSPFAVPEQTLSSADGESKKGPA
jgi:Arc/MetJ-type ribon-helix-helix transcriptional regulator